MQPVKLPNHLDFNIMFTFSSAKYYENYFEFICFNFNVDILTMIIKMKLKKIKLIYSVKPLDYKTFSTDVFDLIHRYLSLISMIFFLG